MAARSRLSNSFYGGVLGLGVLGFASVPFVLHRLAGGHSMTTQAKPLAGHQTMRGAYVNSGSRDAGADPDWVVAGGKLEYKGRSGELVATPEELAAARAGLVARGGARAAGAAPAGGGASP